MSRDKLSSQSLRKKKKILSLSQVWWVLIIRGAQVSLLALKSLEASKILKRWATNLVRTTTRLIHLTEISTSARQMKRSWTMPLRITEIILGEMEVLRWLLCTLTLATKVSFWDIRALWIQTKIRFWWTMTLTSSKTQCGRTFLDLRSKFRK